MDKPIAVYKDDTFRNLIRTYSFDRMARDKAYKRDVYRAIDDRKAAQRAKKEAKP